MGTTHRVSFVGVVGDGVACSEVRGNWRKSNPVEDQNEPEFVRLDRRNGSAPVFLLACPK